MKTLSSKTYLCVFCIQLLVQGCAPAEPSHPDPIDPDRVEDTQSKLESSQIQLSEAGDIKAVEIIGDNHFDGLHIDLTNPTTPILKIGDQTVENSNAGTMLIDTDELLIGSAFGIYEENGEPKYFTTVFDESDMRANGLIVTTAPSAELSIGWRRVDYEYIVYNTDGTQDVITQSDGRILVDINAETWRAEFGAVSLNGHIEGHEVEGLASLHDMSGTFAGFDGQLEQSGQYQGAITFGGYSGESEAGGQFAGGWLERN